MLRELFIRDFAIITELRLSFESGLTVLTGETGAGKSIILDALSLALGARADSSLVRHGADRAEISASFILSDAPQAIQYLRDHDLDHGETLVVRRVLTSEGRSRGYINGSPAPIGQLAELGGFLVEIHGQHEHYQLTNRERQAELLDGWVDDEALHKVAESFASYEALRRELDSVVSDGALSEAEIELLRFQAEELEAARDDIEQRQALDDEHRLLANSHDLLGVCDDALATLDESVTPPLARISAGLSQKVRVDRALFEAAELLESAMVQIQESVAVLNRHRQRLEPDPDRLADLDQRIGQVHELGRKHRRRPEDLLSHLGDLRERLDHAENYATREAQLRQKLDAARDNYQETALALNQARTKAAKKLSRAVVDGINVLGMTGGRFEIDVELDTGRIHRRGADRVTYLVSANPGQPPRPLSDIASGGELSRIGLALRVALTATNRAATLIFDEIDSGVGGPTAELVGEKLAQLGRESQVFCVTHLPQVAAFGDHQFRVGKREQEGETVTDVRCLDSDQRVDEIARMVGGRDLTPESRQHAARMLQQSTVPRNTDNAA